MQVVQLVRFCHCSCVLGIISTNLEDFCSNISDLQPESLVPSTTHRFASHLDRFLIVLFSYECSTDLHTGIDGGAVVEPLNDLLGVLATLVDSRGMVLIPR